MAQKAKNELTVVTLTSDKRVYTFSLRKKEGAVEDLMLQINEKVKNADEKFSANKIRIYNESIDEFFEKIDEIKRMVQNEREGNIKK